ncbi:MAG: 30S ribosome-binding factor RbfA [Ignavibacteriales bacterium]|nr:30S ribosome-binding factor RbfA [Ignavibacteriales bacterium]
MSVRSEKVASLIKEEVSTLVQRNFSMEEFGFLTVTEVRVSPDLRNAKVYISIFGDAARKEKTLSMLEAQKGFIRSSLGRVVRLKFTPTLTFLLDETLDRAMKIEQILNDLHKKDGRDQA